MYFWFIIFASVFAHCSSLVSRYDQLSNEWIKKIEIASAFYTPCSFTNCSCYQGQVENDLRPFKKGILKSTIEAISQKGILYQIIKGKVYRSLECLFPARCEGVQHFLLQIASSLPDTEFILNVHDFPWATDIENLIPVFSFSKDDKHVDILYPTWSFWSGGPAISLYPTGIGRWNATRATILGKASMIKWKDKREKAFFRGSRTTVVRDWLVLLSRKKPDLVDARYTKNQGWRSIKDTLDEKPAEEVTFEDHCYYKYLFNFPGIAASFRYRHIFLCGSVVFHVGNKWIEFFYEQLVPWIHYIPVPENFTDVEKLINFARNHDDIMRTIASRGQKFIANHLTDEDILCYWKLLLQKYTKLLRYKVKRDVNLIQIREEDQ